MRQLKNYLFILLLGGLGLSCSQEKQIAYVDNGTPVNQTPKPEGRRTFNYQTMLTEKTAALSLANATAYTMTLSGCASSQTATVTETNVYLELYEFDRNCVVKLTQFTLNSKVYTPKSGSTFTTWATGDTAVFEVVGASPADELNVEVLQTITNPVTAGGTIHYQFSELTLGTDVTINESIVRESQVMTVDGQAAPDFTVNQVQLVGITATGNGEFRFQLECRGTDVVGVGASMRCYDVLLSDIRLVLVEDTYSGVLTLSDLTSIYAAHSGGISIDTSTEIFSAGAGSPVLTHGGFITANTGDADVMVMSGSKPIHLHPNMLLILKAGPSYLYFNVDVEVINQDGSAP